MKNLITILILFVAVGCSKTETQPAVVTKSDVNSSGATTTNVSMDLTNVIVVCPFKFETNVLLGTNANK